MKIINKIEWYINAKPYRYIMYSMMLNAVESIVLIWVLIKLW